MTTSESSTETAADRQQVHNENDATERERVSGAAATDALEWDPHMDIPVENSSNSVKSEESGGETSNNKRKPILPFLYSQESLIQEDPLEDHDDSSLDGEEARHQISEDLLYRLSLQSNMQIEDPENNEGPADVLFDLFCMKKNGRKYVHIDTFLHELRTNGLREDDPRLRDAMDAFNEFKRQNLTSNIEADDFKRCVSKNITMLSKAFGSEMVIKDFKKFCREVNELFEACQANTTGQNASYIPQLAKMDPNYWAVSVCSVDGQRASFGNSSVPFTLQSTTKPIVYAVVATDHGSEFVHKHVGFEPSGASFNEITLDDKHRPHNPMINSGAIVTASLVKPGHSQSERFDYIFNKFKELAGGIGHVGFNNSVFLSEKATAWRNFALAYFMKEHNCFPENTDIDDTLDIYFQMCSMEVTTSTLAMIAATLANGGISPVTGKKLLEPNVVRDTLSICFSCGMYDFSGQFAFQVGIPAKSSVSGAIMMIVPNVCGIACFSPPIDKCGNSVRGVEFCTKLVEKFGFHNFAPKSKLDDTESNRVELVSIMFAALQGDVSAFRRFTLQGVDLDMKDYDSRTALHIAASEGHLELVKYLIERGGVNKFAKDRWGNTALSEAETFGHSEVVEYLKADMLRRKSTFFSQEAITVSSPNLHSAKEF